MASGGMTVIKNFKIKKNSFYFNTFNFLMLLLLHKTLKGSRNIQGFALIRAVFSHLTKKKIAPDSFECVVGALIYLPEFPMTVIMRDGFDSISFCCETFHFKTSIFLSYYCG